MVIVFGLSTVVVVLLRNPNIDPPFSSPPFFSSPPPPPALGMSANDAFVEEGGGREAKGEETEVGMGGAKGLERKLEVSPTPKISSAATSTAGRGMEDS